MAPSASRSRRSIWILSVASRRELMLSVATVAASKVSTANSQSTAINATPSERPVLRLRIMALFALPPHPLPLLPSPAWKASALYLPPALATAVPSGAGP
ncbi:MAG: hypothetical protein JWO52_4256 [Gammaproteobacteria bacterium]|nr:hypothetical protein [Gammaproteobacteria bacterium]